MATLETRFCGIPLVNPFLLASSPSTDDLGMIARAFEAGWAGAVLKTTSVESDEVRIAYPIMKSAGHGPAMRGLFNTDLISEKRADEMLEIVRQLKDRFPDRRVIVSIEASNRSDWESLARRSRTAGADLVEIALSCPQGTDLEGYDSEYGTISHDPTLTRTVTAWVVEAARPMPAYVKLNSGVTDITAIAAAAAEGGTAGFCVMDSLESLRAPELDSLRPDPGVEGLTSRGGYSGRAIKPVALNVLSKVAAMNHGLPISGVGGVYDWRDAVEYFLLGASNVQVCTGVMQRGFSIIDDLLDGTLRWMERHGFSTLDDYRAGALSSIVDNESLRRDVPIYYEIDPDGCIGCGLCYVACRDGGHQAIEFDSRTRRTTIVKELCVGCGFCRGVCPIDGVIRPR